MSQYSICITISLLLVSSLTIAQGTYQMKANGQEIEANFLLSYYDQDGNNGAVTGGVGTEALQDLATLLVVNVPLDSTRSINVSGGADYYSSASTDAIDNNVSSASSADLRAFSNVSFQQKNLKKGETYGIRLGFSTEYDYNSVSAGLSWAKEWNEGNSELNINGQVFVDQWGLYFPAELRGRVSVPTRNRRSYNLQFTYAQVLNKRLQMAISSEGIFMTGLLSTPFHRVYFQDQSVDIERLPETRLKIPIGFRFNYFATDKIVLRSQYRFYWDDFGIIAHTMGLEAPIKLNNAFTISPFYRFHTQTASDFFAPFAQHINSEKFYTSDFDLSALSSHKIGLSIKYAPIYGLARAKIPFSKRIYQLESIQLRSAYYQRTTGLNAFIVSLELGMRF